MLRLPVVSKTLEFPTAVVTTAQRWPAPPNISKLALDTKHSIINSTCFEQQGSALRFAIHDRIPMIEFRCEAEVSNRHGDNVISPDVMDICRISPGEEVNDSCMCG